MCGSAGSVKKYWKIIDVLALVFFLSSMVGCSAGQTDNQQFLGKYYIDFSTVATSWEGPFDEKGIPLRHYSEFGIQYQPVGIAHYALGNWDLYLSTKQAQYREKFLRMADWFCENLVLKGDFGVWEYRFDYPRFLLKAPWPSAMSQGEGISVLVRAYQLTKDERYLECAQVALGSFKASLEEGGVRYHDEDGFIWYEEYPSLVKPPHVLNGFIFALFGLYDFSKITESEEAQALFNEGIRTLKANLGKWDLGFWSRYDLTDLYDQDTYLFRFVTDKAHPEFPHPIDMIALRTVTEDGNEVSQIMLDVGAEDDATDVSVNGSHLYYSPGYQDWGEPYFLEGKSVRNYENHAGRYAHAPFEFVIDLDPSYKYFLEVFYKDTGNEPIYLEAYVEGVKYLRLSELESVGDGKWKTTSVDLPLSLLTLMKKGASSSYHRWHIQQLQTLFEMTGAEIFKDYAQLFDIYQEAFSLGQWWEDIRKEIHLRQARF